MTTYRAASYHDSARDLLLMVNHFRAEMPRPILGASSLSCSTFLTYEDAIVHTDIFSPHLGIGHSMGGTVIVNLALLHPRLFTTIIPIEPIIKRDQHNQDFTTSYSLTYKQDTWPSLTAAHNSVRRHPFYRTWDSRTLDLFRTHSLRNAGPPKSSLTSPNISPARADPTTVTLKTTRDQETLSYARAAYPPKPTSPLHSWQPSRLTHPDLGSERYPGNAFYRPESFMTFVQLPFLRPSCHYIYGAKTHLATNQAAERALKLQTTGTATGGSGGAEAGRVTETVVDGVGHFLAFEVPELIAGTAGRWMTQEVRRWREEEGNEQAIWGGVERSMRGKVEGDWHLWQERMYGERVRGMAAEAKKRKATKLQKENYKGGKGVPKL